MLTGRSKSISGHPEPCAELVSYRITYNTIKIIRYAPLLRFQRGGRKVTSKIPVDSKISSCYFNLRKTKSWCSTFQIYVIVFLVILCNSYSGREVNKSESNQR